MFRQSRIIRSIGGRGSVRAAVRSKTPQRAGRLALQKNAIGKLDGALPAFGSTFGSALGCIPKSIQLRQRTVFKVLTELTQFSQIPVKVTMNEYIEISKQFSSQKSKLFINGILDKLVTDLTEEKMIRKTGRGLMT